MFQLKTRRARRLFFRPLNTDQPGIRDSAIVAFCGSKQTYRFFTTSQNWRHVVAGPFTSGPASTEIPWLNPRKDHEIQMAVSEFYLNPYCTKSTKYTHLQTTLVCEELSWDPSESLVYDVTKQLNVLYQATSYFSGLSKNFQRPYE
ncbi:hypothetical protein T265_02447 [Opisthorchis viverrini]|uniref:Uncharacterized protein n=1 Tax=Opisthorchis viverrini TaxID=6198 RepID=A0A075A6J5_OPIVI|nr:hypothetical protein T265_02447 [Opisthorchis viverrini]KER31255.1 hypothetical protein T265_02447 [Opisthorchis viverrini]